MRRSQRVKMNFWVWLVALSLPLIWVGCTKAIPNPPGTNYNSVAYVTLMNMAPYSPPVEIYLNDMRSTPSIPAGAYSTSYAHLTPGVYDVKFKVAGGDSVLSDIPSSSYDSLNFYTLILYNDSVKGPARSVKIHDNYSGVNINNTNFRFIHMCPEAPALDVYLNGNLIQQGRTAGDIVGTPSYTLFQSLAPNAYNLELKQAGTGTVLYSVTGAELGPGNAYTFFLSGSASYPTAADPIAVGVLKAAY